MIRQANTRVITQTFEAFEVPTLAIFRQAPLKFTLTDPKSVSTPFSVYLNNDYTKNGAYDLIEFIKNLAISQAESWSAGQIQQAKDAKTIYIIYNDFNQMVLDFSSKLLTKETLQEENPSAEIWVSYDTSDMGLILLVNELLDWLKI